MKRADYKCDNCGQIEIITIPNSENFPKEVVCNQCLSDCRRIYTPAYSICHQGKAGNYKNGYSSTGGNIKKT